VPTTLDEGQQRLLAELSQHPAWPVLRGVCRDKMEREFTRLAKELMRPHSQPPTDLDYRRGFFAGMKFLLDKPVWESQDIDRALKAQGEVK
jgi:hypothetical protein